MVKKTATVSLIEDIDFSRFSCFDGLTQSDISLLRDEFKLVHFNKGDVIIQLHSRCSAVFLVIAGFVKTIQVGSDGREQIVRIDIPGDLFGFEPLITDHQNSTLSVAVSNGIMGAIAGDAFLRFANMHPAFYHQLLKLEVFRLDQINHVWVDQVQLTVAQRLAKMILHFSERTGINEKQEINLCLSREEMAELSGTTTESVIRALSEFKQCRIIDFKGRRIRILKREMLMKKAGLQGFELPPLR